jgi:hypothetical protein
MRPFPFLCHVDSGFLQHILCRGCSWVTFWPNTLESLITQNLKDNIRTEDSCKRAQVMMYLEVLPLGPFFHQYDLKPVSSQDVFAILVVFFNVYFEIQWNLVLLENYKCFLSLYLLFYFWGERTYCAKGHFCSFLRLFLWKRVTA